jgi:RNA polymerase sigma factor, sigma-70 family
MAKGRYCKHLPQHVINSELEDLNTISQLELIETIKNWDPINNEEVWPLAQTRITGALKDHIRYITKSNPTRVYEWVTEQARNYISTKTQTDHVAQYADKDQVKQAMKILTERERLIIHSHIKQDLTFKSIGENINLSESQVSRIYKGAIKKMKKVIEKET